MFPGILKNSPEKINNPTQYLLLRKDRMKTLTMTLCLLCLFAINVLGQDSNRGGRDGAPQEAFSACEGKSAGDAAEFENSQGETVEGICEEQGNRLILKPTNFVKKQGMDRSSRSMDRPNGAPAEAFTACEGKSAGDTASFESPRGDTVEGICEKQGNRLVLRPNNPPR